MHQHRRHIVVGLAVVIGLGVAQPAGAATVHPNVCGATGSPTLVIDGPDVQTTTYGTTTYVTGDAGVDSTVGVWFRQAFHSTFTRRRTLQTGCGTAWHTTYAPNDDYRIYATSGSEKTRTVLVQLVPTIAGAQQQTIKRGTNYYIIGTGNPGATLTLHFHKQGTPSTDYSIIRTVKIDSHGNYTRPYLADVDYRFFASLPNGQVSPPHLVQAG